VQVLCGEMTRVTPAGSAVLSADERRLTSIPAVPR
jgi:hypothetical protein